jgi:putative ABC transport system permease protein
MRVLARFFARLRNFAVNRRSDERLQEEMEQHIAFETEDKIRAGMSPEEARRRARLEFGAVESIREDYHSEEGLPLLENLIQDARFTLRILTKAPGFSTAAVLTLALGIGACTAIFSAVNPILFEPLPYPHANRILTIWSTFRGVRSRLAFGNWREIEERNHSFEALAVYEPWQPVLVAGEQPERLNGQKVTASYLRVLGVEPWLGRDFHSDEDRYHGPAVAILSYRLWQQKFGGDRGIIGGAVTLDGDRYTVIGVMPAGFENVLSSQADIWTPLDYNVQALATDFESGEWGNHLYMVGRVRPGVSREAAARDLEAIAANRIAQFQRPPWAALRHGLIIDSLQEDITREVRPALLAVMGAVFLVLLMAGVNVTNLQLARGAQRQGEFAMRVTLGAGRIRVVRQLITESLLLAGLGGAVGVAIAIAGVRALMAMSPPGLPRIDAIRFSGEAFVFALALTTLVGVVAGVVPALSASREYLREIAKQSWANSTRSDSWTRRTLVVSEMALALVLLAGAGLLLRSMQRLLAVDPGFNPSNLLTMQIKTSGHEFDDTSAAPNDGSDARRRFFEQALDAVRRVPGVTAAGLTTNLPLTDDAVIYGTYGARFEGDPPNVGTDVFRYVVSPGYCEAMQIPLRRGRFLSKLDGSEAPLVVLISESLAKSEFPGQDPIGKRLHVGPTDRPWYTVVGVVGDVKQNSLVADEPNAVYLTEAQSWFADDTMSVVVRERDVATPPTTAIENAIWSVDKNQALVRVATAGQLVLAGKATRHFVLMLFAAFALVALALAATGIYGVLSGSVTERTREIGVRSALGASRGDIFGLVLGKGMTLAAIGAAFGLCAAVVSSSALVSLLFGVSRLDPLTYLSVTTLLLAVAAAACAIPAARAVVVDPVQALRSE